jgi:hypothetical protein
MWRRRRRASAGSRCGYPLPLLQQEVPQVAGSRGPPRTQTRSAPLARNPTCTTTTTTLQHRNRTAAWGALTEVSPPMLLCPCRSTRAAASPPPSSSRCHLAIVACGPTTWTTWRSQRRHHMTPTLRAVPEILGPWAKTYK